MKAYHALLLLLAAMMLLTACTPETSLSKEPVVVPEPIVEPVVRPNVSRVGLKSGGGTSGEPGVEPSGLQRPFLYEEGLNVYSRPGTESLVAGDAEHPFLVGMTLGEVLPLLTRNELRLLANPQPSFHGQPLRAENYVRFDFEENSTGLLRFAAPEDDDGVPDLELFFADGAPMFEYAFLLRDGAFPVLVGETINFFGNSYVVQKASNTTILLQGVNVEQDIALDNNSRLKVNGHSYSDTLVTVDPWSVIITYYAPSPDDGGVRLHRGESLRDKFSDDTVLLNKLFDVKLEGLELNEERVVEFDVSGESVRLSFTDALGRPITLDVASVVNGSLRWGGVEERLHVEECPGSEYCILPDDWFVVNTHDGVSSFFQYRSVSSLGDVLTLKDPSREEHVVKLVDTERKEENLSVLDGTIDIEDSLFHVHALHNESPERERSPLHVDGGYDERTFFLLDAHELRFPVENETNNSLVVKLVSPRDYQADLDEEVLSVTISLDAGALSLGVAGGNVSLQEVPDEEEYHGLSERGVLATLDDSVDGERGETLSFDYPADYRAGLVRVYG